MSGDANNLDVRLTGINDHLPDGGCAIKEAFKSVFGDNILHLFCGVDKHPEGAAHNFRIQG